MGTLTGTDIVTRALEKANDTAGDHWGAAEQLRLVNDSQRFIVSKVTKAGAQSAMATLQAGSRQTLSGLSLARGIEFIDVVCNVSGTTRGAPIHKTKRALLDDEVPGWHTATGSAVENWCHDERDPTAIYIYPNSGAKIEVIYAAPPADLAALSNTIGLDDIWAEAMQLYVLWGFFSKDITKIKSREFAASYMNQLMNELGLREKSIVVNTAAGDAKEQGA